jgi:hypothetical protein
MPKQLPHPRSGFLELPPELRLTIYEHIANACVHLTLHPAIDNGSSSVVVVTFIPASTIRLVCKEIAHEAKAIVLKTANRTVVEEYRHLSANPLGALIIQLDTLRLLTSKDSILDMAGRWSMVLDKMNSARFMQKQGIGTMNEEVSKLIESAGRSMSKYRGQTDINIVIEPGTGSEVTECVMESETHDALEAMSLTYDLAFHLHYVTRHVKQRSVFSDSVNLAWVNPGDIDILINYMTGPERALWDEKSWIGSEI